MKRYFICFLTIGLFLVICPPGYAQTSKMAIVGTWKLICIEKVDLKGNVIGPDEVFLGKRQAGLIIYGPSGYMSLQYMRLEPPAPSPDSLQEIADAFGAYCAYFGTYEVKETEGKEGKEGVIVHHLQGSLRTKEVGKDFWRKFKISGNRLFYTIRWMP